jgi:RNA polymerase sigma-70 factor (ECF subfamily)
MSHGHSSAAERNGERSEGPRLVSERNTGEPASPLDLDEIVKAHSAFVYNVAYRMMGNHVDAEDVVQDAFLSAFRSRDKFKGASQVTTWLYRITVNAALMRLRKRSRKVEVPTDPTEMTRAHDAPDHRATPDQALLSQELAQRLQASIARLPPDLRAAVVLRDVQGLTNEEAAAILELTVTALKTRLHRGRVAVRDLLAPYLSGR